MKFLIAGLGSIGRRHLRNLLALGERDIVLYHTRRGSLAEEELAAFTIESDLSSALTHRPDVAIIANPTALHLDVAIPAAAAGCHLLIEKPISNSLDRIENLRAAVHDGCGKVLVGFQFRFHPGLQLAAHLLNDGAIGRPLSVGAHWGEYLPDWHPWEDYRQSYSARADLGGGSILTLCHPFDYLRWLLGEVTAISAVTRQLSDLELQVEDTAEVVLQFANGALGSVHLDYCQQPATHRFEIIGTQGTLRWDNADGSLRLYRATTKVWEEFPPPANFERNDMFVAEIQHLVSVIRNEVEPICTLDDGQRVLQLALAAKFSAQRSCMVQV